MIMLLGAVLPITIDSINADENSTPSQGFGKGVPWQPFEIMKRTTFVNFDKDTLVDDYAYLASIPSSVFSDGNTLYTSPLLFFQPKNSYPDEEKYRFLNDYQGTHYLMEDWMGYCNGRLDKLVTINMGKNDIEPEWNSKEHIAINSDNPFEIASKIALEDWSYSDEAVLAVIEKEYEKPEDTEFSNTIEGKVSGEIEKESFKIKRPYGPASEYEYFTIGSEYKYVEVDLWYPSIVRYSSIVGSIPGFKNPTPITLPSVDPDLQLYCNFEGEWIQTSLAAEMAITNGPHEEVLSYVYSPGDWKVGVTNMPTEGGESFVSPGPFNTDIYGSLKDALKSLNQGVSKFNVEVTKYPGIEIEIPDTPPFGCRDGVFELTWDNENINLGLTIVGPSGEEIDSVMQKNDDQTQEIKIKYIGECLENEHFKAVVYALKDISTPTDFELTYSWNQNISRKEADMLSSACQGAVLGSIENSPLLFITPDSISSCTKDALLKLGVKEVSIINLGGYLTKDNRNSVEDITEIKKEFKEYQGIYDYIREKTDSTYIVFSTVDPWSYWYYVRSANTKADGEYKGAFHFAPAAYAAAHHGTPVLLVDNHAELSSSLTWHSDFWNKNANGFTEPPVACMHLTGTRVYDFLEKIGFDKQGDESILTVSGQFDIGPTWPRVFAGVANTGAIIGTPVDVTNHISRCIFYPALIFENPAMQEKITLINGSVSKRVFHTDNPIRLFEVLLARLSKDTPGLSNLKILRKSGPEEYTYPVLHTYACYCHRVNERAADYWGVTYKTRRGYTPNEDLSGEEIDLGVREIFEGKPGSFLPDLSVTVYTPFYASKAGYSNAYSTNFEITMDNLNQGVISWYMVLHGVSNNGGRLSWIEPAGEALVKGVPKNVENLVDSLFNFLTGSGPFEENPWRGYEMWWGSTEEPDSAILNSKIGILQGWTNAVRPRDLLDKGLFKTGLDIVPSHLAGYYDGQVGPYSITGMVGKTHYSHPSTEVDDLLENLHSMSFHAGSCLIGCNYLQILMQRHGSVSQEMDPWATSYWGSYTYQMIPREFALGKTIGESYSHGITEIGPQYVFDDDDPVVWWWDSTENVVLFADPDLRIWVPSTDYDKQERNNWEEDDVRPMTYDEELDINGHMPFGATSYPNKLKPASILEKYLPLILIIIVIILILIAVALSRNKKKK